VKQLLTIRFFVLLIILSFLGSCTEEKLEMDTTGSIAGRVLDEEDLSPIVNAEVSTNPPTHIVLTDSMGNFELEDVQVGDYNVIAKQKDYFTSSTAIKVNMNLTTQLIINLTQRITDIDLPEFTDNYYPANEQTDIPVNTVFSWQVKNRNDSVTYNLKLYESGQPESITMENLTDTFALVTGLKFSTTYLWQLSAENSRGTIYTDIRTFTTHTFPENFLLYAKRVDDASQIFVADTLADMHIQLTHNNFHSWRPLANPQKTRIAFLSTQSISPQLYTMKPDGTDVRKITDIATGGYYNKGVGFSWLPDGERLVFSAYNKLYVVNWDGTGLSSLTAIDPERHFREVDWSPTNNKIVALTIGINRYDAEIILMNTNGSGKEVIVGDKVGALENPVFSIDGKRFLYTYDVSDFQSAVGRQLDARIFEYNIETGSTRSLSNGKPPGTNDLNPRYTANGAHIVFVNTYNTVDARRDLWIMRSDSTQSQYRRKLVEGVESPDW
jgi:TolB protein